MNKSQIALLEKVSGILVNMMIFPAGLLILPFFFADRIDSRIASINSGLPYWASHWYLFIMLVVAFTVGTYLRKYHDKLEKTANRSLTGGIVAFRTSVITLYGAIVVWGLVISPGAMVLGYFAGAVIILLAVLLVAAKDIGRRHA